MAAADPEPTPVDRASANVLHTPLQPYGSYNWYRAPGLRSDFCLVVCDGPLGHTRGGRYGLLPRMRHQLRTGATILLDDAQRPEEQHVLRQWEQEAG